MFSPPNDDFSNRRQAAIAAREALVAKMKPKAARPASSPIDRAAERALDLRQVRLGREQAKVDRRLAAEAAGAATAQAAADQEAAALELKRGARRDRKALTAVEAKAAKAKRDERYAARRARSR